MSLGEKVFEDQLKRPPVGNVLVALPALVLDHAALVVELLLSEGIGQKAHSIRFQPQHVFQGLAGHCLEVVGAIEAGGAVDPTFPHVGSRPFHIRQILSIGVPGPLEHHMLEQVSHPGAARLLVLGADVIPQVDVGYGKLGVGMQNDLKAVGQAVFLKIDDRGLSHGFQEILCSFLGA